MPCILEVCSPWSPPPEPKLGVILTLSACARSTLPPSAAALKVHRIRVDMHIPPFLNKKHSFILMDSCLYEQGVCAGGDEKY
jgi:hypothetical protein